jgi:hypothetical protein
MTLLLCCIAMSPIVLGLLLPVAFLLMRCKR